MQKIDAHQHFWRFDPVRDGWITDSMAVLRQDFLPQHLAPLLQPQNIEGCVAVQASQSEEETNFLLQLADQFDIIKGVVGWVDLQSENIGERLEHFAAFKKLKGFRHIVQAEPQDDFILGEAFCRGISLLQSYGFTYDILVYPMHLTYVEEFVRRFPEQPFVIDHAAKPYIKEGKLQPWKKNIEQLAKQENVSCKLSGLVTEADWRQWRPEDFIPCLDVVVQAFGTDRILFGSDWPVCLLAASYEEVINIIHTYFASFSEEEQAKVFGENAIKFYNL